MTDCDTYGTSAHTASELVRLGSADELRQDGDQGAGALLPSVSAGAGSP